MATLKDIFNVTEYRFDNLIDEYNIKQFIETGTGMGDTVEFCLNRGFDNITSIEIHPDIANKASERFKNEQSCKIINDNSFSAIEKICQNSDKKTIFWLDAHFPGVDFNYYNLEDEKNTDRRIPLEKELEIITKNKKDISGDIFIIDDLRIYEDGPYDAGNWELRKKFGGNGIGFLYKYLEKTHHILKYNRFQGFAICLPKKNIKDGKIPIVIPYNDRINYLRITLSTLKEACRGLETEIYLYNTCPDKKNSNVPIFKDFDNLNIKHLTCTGIDSLLPKVITDAFDSTDNNFIILLDSDTLVHPEAINKFMEMYRDIPNLGIGTLFNTTSHRFHTNVNDRYGSKVIIGGFGLIIKRNAWKKHGRNVRKDWDVVFPRGVFNSDEYSVYCSYDSYLEHIGMTGTHKRNKEGEPLSIDRASNFFD